MNDSSWNNSLLKKIGKAALKAVDSAANALNVASHKLDEVTQQINDGTASNKIAKSVVDKIFKTTQDMEKSKSEKYEPVQKKASDVSKVHTAKQKKGKLVIHNGVLNSYSGHESHIVIEEGVQKIDGGVFFGNKYLEIVELPDSLTEIGASAFESCIALKSILGGKNLKWIKKQAFQNCRAIESVEFGACLLYVDYEAFKNCSALKSVSFAWDSPLEGLEGNTFSGCSSLSEIKWPGDIHHVFESAIHNCPLSDKTIENLNRILKYSEKRHAYVRPGVIKSDSFGKLSKKPDDNSATESFVQNFFQPELDDDAKLRKLIQERIDYQYGDDYQNDVVKEVPELKREKLDGGLYVEGDRLVGLDCDIVHLIIPEQIRIIANEFANQCRKLESIVVEGRIDKVEKNAFRELSQLKEVLFKEDVKELGDSAFFACSALENVTFEKGVETILDYAFGKCSALRNILLPDTVQSLGEGVFLDCTSFEEICLPESCLKIGKDLFAGCKSIKKVHLPKSLKRIPQGTFKQCYKLEEIEWPDEYREDGRDYPVVEQMVFLQAIMDDCCEKFVLKDGVMKRELIDFMEEDPTGAFQLILPGEAGYIERIPQFLMNATLNVAWEVSMLPEQYRFQMDIIKTCMSLANILTLNKNNENRAERLYAVNAIREIQLASTLLTSSFTKMVMPLAICETLYAIGGNGKNRKEQICHLLKMAHGYIPFPNHDGMTPEDAALLDEAIEKGTNENLLRCLGNSQDTPFYLSPHVWRYTLPILSENGSNTPENAIYVECSYYEVVRGIQSMLEYQYQKVLLATEDFSNEATEMWLLKLGNVISEGSNNGIHLVVFRPENIFPKNIEESIYYERLKPVFDACEHSFLEFVTLLIPSQIDAIQEILSNCQIEDIMTDYSAGIRLIKD